MHPFSTNGTIKTIKDTLYYVGGYDPYIKKYVDGVKSYSRATIDNHDSSLNYITVISNDSRSTSLSPAAIFSSRDFDVKRDPFLLYHIAMEIMIFHLLMYMLPKMVHILNHFEL